MCINCGPTFGCTDTCPFAYKNSHPVVQTPEETTLYKALGCASRQEYEAVAAVAIRAYTTGKLPPYADERTESVDHPQHYGGDTPYEAIKVIEAWELGFCLGNAVKYISRAGKKDRAKTVEDLKKAAWYLDREIKKLEN